ncbi:MAG: hypothetical protein CL808_08315 [Citromicrobium sp.]|nr:hypothetical protein [Citromicrobium sp.]
MKIRLTAGIVSAMLIVGGALLFQDNAQAAQDDRLTPAQQRDAVAQAIATQCPAKSRRLAKVRCTPMGFDGDRYSCRYEIEDRFGTQMLTITNNGGGWRPQNAFNMCDMPPLAISARPQKAQLAQAARRECGRSAPVISTAMCSPTVNAAREDTFTCRYSASGISGQQKTDIYLRRGRWTLADRDEVCPRRRRPAVRRTYTRDRDELPGRYELAVAMFETCPGTAKDLSSTACEATGEPSEFSCMFRTNAEPDPDSTLIARDGDSWTLIDIPNTCRAR